MVLWKSNSVLNDGIKTHAQNSVIKETKYEENKKVSEFDKEIPQSHTADQPIAP